MKKILALLLLTLASVLAVTPQPQITKPQTTQPQTTAIPRERISLSCTDSYFKSARQNFLLADEVYPTCTLRLPLALNERWPGQRTFYLIPRVSASLAVKGERGQSQWLPLSPLVTPGPDPLHSAVSSRDYQVVELTGHFGKLADLAASRKADTVSAGGKLTVCAAPVYPGEEPCHTFDVAARFKVYTR